MVIIKIFSGFGNQLFQYALYESLKSKGKEVYADLLSQRAVEEEYQSATRKPMVNNAVNGLKNLNIQMDIMKDKDMLEYYRDERKDVLNMARRKLLGRRRHIYESNVTEYGKFFPKIFDLDNVYLDGYWQSEKYFADIRDTILEKIRFRQSDDARNQDILEKINNTNSVSVHIRRGDYLDKDIVDIYGNICTPDYYKRSISSFMDRGNNPCFFFFSNDIGWVKNEFESLKADKYFIDWNTRENDYYDMYLMSQCKNNIIANSSFSWWGAWLNENDNKRIIAPQKWFHIGAAEDIICPAWERI